MRCLKLQYSQRVALVINTDFQSKTKEHFLSLLSYTLFLCLTCHLRLVGKGGGAIMVCFFLTWQLLFTVKPLIFILFNMRHTPERVGDILNL